MSSVLVVIHQRLVVLVRSDMFAILIACTILCRWLCFSHYGSRSSTWAKAEFTPAICMYDTTQNNRHKVGVIFIPLIVSTNKSYFDTLCYKNVPKCCKAVIFACMHKIRTCQTCTEETVMQQLSIVTKQWDHYSTATPLCVALHKTPF